MLPDNKEASDSAGEESPIDQSHASPTGETMDAAAVDNTSTEADSENIVDLAGFGDELVSEEHKESDATTESEADLEEDEDEVSVLQRQLLEAEGKLSDQQDERLRHQAEIENLRKRAQNDVTKARKFALEGIVNDLLPVRDSLEMGLAAAAAQDADPKAIIEGADLTLKMLAQLFEKNNIAEINPVDEKFDPEFHQAMSKQEVEGKASNTVTSVMQKGYTLNDRLVRPALVMVAK